MKMYTLKGYNPKEHAPHNVKTWAKVKPLFDKNAVVSEDRLIQAAFGHPMVGGARGFILYLAKRGYITPSPFAS